MPNYVTLILDLADGSGSPVAKGAATLSPSVQLTDSADGMDVVAPVTASFRQGSYPQVRLLATDNGNVSPLGWQWTLTFSGVPGNPVAQSFFLPFAAGATQHLSALTTVPAAVPITITSLDGGSAVTGTQPAGNVDGGRASG